jgi:hypothetical protein
MARKVKIQNLIAPIGITYAVALAAVAAVAGLALAIGEKFSVFRLGDTFETQLGFTDLLGAAFGVCLMSFVVINISVFLARPRLYVLIAGYTLFLIWSLQPFTSVKSLPTALWLTLIHLVLSVPIFYGIYKYVPKLNPKIA